MVNDKLKNRSGAFQPPRSLQNEHIEKFTSFFVFPFYFDETLKPNSAWKESFHIPKKEKEIIDNWARQKNYAEYIYFHDYVRLFLFDAENNAQASENCQSGRQAEEKEKSDSKDCAAFYTYNLEHDLGVTA